MDGFGDAPLVGPGSELQLTIDGHAIADADVVAAADARAPRAGDGVGEETLFPVGALLAARAATPATGKRSGTSAGSIRSLMRAATYSSPRRKPDRDPPTARFVATPPGVAGD